MKTSKTFKSKVITCKECSGRGTIENSELEDYHRVEYRYWNTVCEDCNGSGRLWKTVTTEITPYDNPEVPALLAADTDNK